MADSPLVFCIVLNWNGMRWLDRCLVSLLQTDYPNFVPLIVDNGSTDGSVEFVRLRFPSVEILENGQNLGFAEGNNQGMHLALERGADYIVLLNNDMRFDPNWCRALIDVAQSNPSWGALGAFHRDYNDSRQWERSFVELMGRDPSFKQGLMTGNLNPIYQTNWVIGAAILLRVDVIKKVGMLDPHYFMYGEENDLCRRIRFHGWKIAYVRDAIVYHHGGFLSEDKQHERLIWQLRSTMIYYIKDPFCLSARGFWRSFRTTLSAKRITKGELSLYEVVRCWIEVVLMSRSLLKRRYLEMFSPQDLPELKQIF